MPDVQQDVEHGQGPGGLRLCHGERVTPASHAAALRVYQHQIEAAGRPLFLIDYEGPLRWHELLVEKPSRQRKRKGARSAH